MDFTKFGNIYKITNTITNKVYIGQTTRCPNLRFIEHLSKSKYLKNHLNYSIVKYGKENFKLDILYTSFSSKDLNQKEIYFINYFKSLTPSGYNLIQGGNDRKYTKEVCDKISNALKGRKCWSEEDKKRISIRQTGKTHTKENKLKMAIIQGAKLFNVYKVKISKGNGYKSYSYEKGEFVGSWINKSECSRDLKIDSSAISKCIKGKKKSHKNYIFELAEGGLASQS